MSKNIADMIFAVAFVQLSSNLQKLYTEKILTEKQFSLVVAGQADTIRHLYLAGLAPEQKEEKPLEVQVSEGLKETDQPDYTATYVRQTFSEEVFDIWNRQAFKDRDDVLSQLLEVSKEYPEWPESLNEMLADWEERKGLSFPALRFANHKEE
jgi:hypothetical protein